MRFNCDFSSSMKHFKTYKTMLAATALTMLISCGEKDIILEGDRSPIRPETVEVQQRDVPFSPPAAETATRSNQAIKHHTLSGSPQLVFSQKVGESDTRRNRITSAPVITERAIYTIDPFGAITALTLDGDVIWRKQASVGLDQAQDASGSALTVAGDRLYAVTAHGLVLALKTDDGSQIWSQKLKAPATAAPVIQGNILYVLSRNNKAWAISADTGRVQWQLSSSPVTAGFSAGARPALTKDIALFPFAGGEVIATFPKGGIERWRTTVSGERLGSVAAKLSDISGQPVIMGRTAYVGNFSGAISAIDLHDGARLWTLGEGLAGQLYVADNTLFFVNDLNELLRVDAKTGSVIWRTALPLNTLNRWGDVSGRHAHYGPILANESLLVASTDGILRSFDPVTGRSKAQQRLSSPAASQPVIARNTLYIIGKNGHLEAYR